jgi:hypothetical protein
MALALGDTTARDAGRLSLNPLKHIDPIGSVILPLFLILVTQGQGPIFGWAKPVPVNYYNLRDKKWGVLKVSIAGPATNFSVGIFFCILIRFFNLPQTLLILNSSLSFGWFPRPFCPFAREVGESKNVFSTVWPFDFNNSYYFWPELGIHSVWFVISTYIWQDASDVT